MAKPNIKKKKTGPSRGSGTTRRTRPGGGRISERQKQRGNDALRGMLIGGAIIGIVAILVFYALRSGAFDTADEPETPPPAESSRTTTPSPRVANATVAKPMERVTADEQAALDEVIRRKSQE